MSDAAVDAALHELTDHRVTEFQNNVLPWLKRYTDIGPGTRVLEIGAGTGASVTVLAATGASVDGVDILEGHLEVARWRVAQHELHNAALHCLNATELAGLYSRPYDLILFSAVLEHMTYSERLQALSEAWANLQPGGVLCIYETPNRLWHRDDHTSILPFFHWLPDELALKYASRSPRREFADNITSLPTDQSLARWGRGASFHELDLAIGLDRITFGESLSDHLTAQHPGYRHARETAADAAYRALLSAFQPALPTSFFEATLDMIAIKQP